MWEGTQLAAELETGEEGGGVCVCVCVCVCVKCDYREKNKVIKRSEFGSKSKSNLLTWRTAKSASIHSFSVEQAGWGGDQGVTARHKELDLEGEYLTPDPAIQRTTGHSTA